MCEDDGVYKYENQDLGTLKAFLGDLLESLEGILSEDDEEMIMEGFATTVKSCFRKKGDDTKSFLEIEKKVIEKAAGPYAMNNISRFRVFFPTVERKDGKLILHRKQTVPDHAFQKDSTPNEL